MKEKLLNNLGLKVASLVLAFIVWMAVVNISNPVIDDSQTVAVEVRNEEVLKAANLTYEIIGKDVATVSYQVRTRDRSLIKASDFHAYIDLKDYNVTGAVPITVEINKEKENLIKGSDITAKPMVLRVMTEELQRKRFELQVTAKGTPEDGYALGTISLTPDYVTVEGPESQIGQISRMGVEIDVENANTDISVSTVPIFYDANGNALDLGDKVTANRQEITCQVSVLKAKNLNLNFEVSGQVAEGYRFTGVECDVKSVPVVGTKSVLASITALAISSEKLNIDGATADKVVHLDLSEYLPPSTSVLGEENKKVTVTMKVEPLTTRVFTLSLEDVTKTGAMSDYDYSFDKTTSSVTVKGLKEDLDTLEEKALNAVLDVTDLEPGVHPGVLSFEVGEGFEIVGFTPFHVTVGSENSETSGAESQEAENETEIPANGTSVSDKWTE